jgi:glycerol kinase
MLTVIPLIFSKHGLLATVAYHFGQDRKPTYALEGSIAVAGSGVKFLVNNFGFASHSHKISDLAATVDDNGGCVFVTAFSGLFAPYWIDDAKGTIFGITQHTERGHIARATLESTCFQTKAILDAMEKDSSHALTELAVDGVSASHSEAPKLADCPINRALSIIMKRNLVSAPRNIRTFVRSDLARPR